MAGKRRRCGVRWSVLWTVLGVVARGDTIRSFDAPLPGTSADSSGAGTGFTHRLAGTLAAERTAAGASLRLRPGG